MQGKRNSPLRHLLTQWGVFGAIAVGSLGWSGCATQAATRFSPEAVAALSPRAVQVGPFEAMRLATKYVAEHPETEFLVGSGDSMLPLYKDHTVVVTQRIAMSDLRAGMTVVYIGESGRPVAHVLVMKTFGGWLAMGVGNAECDATPVTQSNLMGIVIKAFEPSGSPMVALLNEAASKSAFASMP
jgi:hypothetical protein